MIRPVFLILFFALVINIKAQPPAFSIIDSDGNPLSEVSIISGVPLLLNTNFVALRGEEVIFNENHETSSDVTPFEIGFPFSFYGEPYTRYYVGANGYITFDEPPRNPAPTLDSIPYNRLDPPYPLNSIFGAFKGWDVASGNYVTRATMGESPGRMLVLTWCDVPALESDSTGTFQIILHENGSIDIHLIRIPESDYAGNRTATGIQSSNPFIGMAVPGRNYGPWPPASSESWRFRWADNDYEVDTLPYSPVAVAEHIDWYEPDAIGGRRLLGSGSQLFVNPRLSTRYIAEITSCWGEVIAQAEIWVRVEGIFPNAFRPNSMHDNSTFRMPSIPGAAIVNYRLQIYNRWGQLVFETADHRVGWNGRMNNIGQECPQGVYHWILMVEQNGESPITNSGAVMLLR